MDRIFIWDQNGLISLFLFSTGLFSFWYPDHSHLPILLIYCPCDNQALSLSCRHDRSSLAVDFFCRFLFFFFFQSPRFLSSFFFNIFRSRTRPIRGHSHLRIHLDPLCPLHSKKNLRDTSLANSAYPFLADSNVYNTDHIDRGSSI